MIINRAWAMPNKWTFQIQPIKELLNRYVGDGKDWIDAYSGTSTLAEISNDINHTNNAKYHLDALAFLKQLQGQHKGFLFDPPYSLRQMKECYDSLGIKMTGLEMSSGFNLIRKEASRLVMQGGLAISCGWNTTGMNKENGFEIIEILLVCHGGVHNDTIVTVERKITANSMF